MRGGARRQQRPGVGSMMLFMQVMQDGVDNIPPVTLGLVLLNCIAFYNPPIPFLPVDFGWARDACLSGAAVIIGGQWGRVWTSCFFHLSDMHLYMNMSSLIWKGRILEYGQNETNF